MAPKLAVFFMSFILLLSVNCKANLQDPPKRGWNLIWFDEFNYTGLPDSSKWGYDEGGKGWGNHELEYYTAKRLENARVEDSVLVIEARKEKWSNREYTSARLVSRNKGDWTYGRFEIRAKLPSGKGTWPAIWMLPTKWTYGNGGWPDNGEIDIMEYVGYDKAKVHGSTHSKAYYWRINTQKTAITDVPDAETEFHVYAMEWSKDKIEMFVDTTKYFTFINEGKGWEVWPFDKDFHMILNLAIGGDWGGVQGIDDSIFPQKLLIDYVRVYKWTD